MIDEVVRVDAHAEWRAAKFGGRPFLRRYAKSNGHWDVPTQLKLLPEQASLVGMRSSRIQLRTLRSEPIVHDFFQWATTVSASVLPKSPLGEAIGYAIKPSLASRTLSH